MVKTLFTRLHGRKKTASVGGSVGRWGGSCGPVLGQINHVAIGQPVHVVGP